MNNTPSFNFCHLTMSFPLVHSHYTTLMNHNKAQKKGKTRPDK